MYLQLHFSCAYNTHRICSARRFCRKYMYVNAAYNVNTPSTKSRVLLHQVQTSSSQRTTWLGTCTSTNQVAAARDKRRRTKGRGWTDGTAAVPFTRALRGNPAALTKPGLSFPRVANVPHPPEADPPSVRQAVRRHSISSPHPQPSSHSSYRKWSQTPS